MKIELGDYYDNFEFFQFAKWQIQLGREQEGLELLHKLKIHIERTREMKSERNLLPNIAFYENSLTGRGALIAMI
jgi:hypothetical protein